MIVRTLKKMTTRIDLHIKDLRNALGTSHEVGAPLLLTAAVLEIFTAPTSDGHEGDDHSGLVLFYESIARTTLDPATPTT